MNSRGFTLLEVLVALAVLAIALGAATRVAFQTVRTDDALLDRTAAHWLAQNLAAEIRLALPAQPVASHGEARMGRRRYAWSIESRGAAETRAGRVRILVTGTDGTDLARLEIDRRVPP